MERLNGDEQSNALAKICVATISAYDNELHDYLSDSEEKKITQADVIVMIMNLTISISTSLYYSLKEYLPNVPMDFDFMKAKIINSLVKNFDDIKNYTPKNKMLALTPEQIKEIMDKGFFILKLEDGLEFKVTEKDLLFKKDEIEKLAAERDKERSNAYPTEIITQSH